MTGSERTEGGAAALRVLIADDEATRGECWSTR